MAARKARPVAERGALARALAETVLATPEVQRAATVAAYVGVGSEPGTGPLRQALREAGKRVLLPVLRPDRDLDWATYAGERALGEAPRGLLEPTGPRLGVDAVATADVVLVPGLAVAFDGLRLGRGGGSYDRALRRVPVGTPVWVLLHEDEVGRDVPRAAHDLPVTGAATPVEVVRF